jgi:hypothetical protein
MHAVLKYPHSYIRALAAEDKFHAHAKNTQAKNGARKYSIYLGHASEFAGRVIWSKFRPENPQILGGNVWKVSRHSDLARELKYVCNSKAAEYPN